MCKTGFVVYQISNGGDFIVIDLTVDEPELRFVFVDDASLMIRNINFQLTATKFGLEYTPKTMGKFVDFEPFNIRREIIFQKQFD